MMKGYVKLLKTIGLISTALIASLPANGQSISDSIILSAMRDELQRNAQELVLEEDQKPFFLAYTLNDINRLNISASLGALQQSKARKHKDWLVRLMVGDYAINDENFSTTEVENSVYRQRVDMPIEDDYEGIRRSLWLTTNDIFYSALHSYKKKRALIENGQIKESDLEIEDFSKEAPVQKTIRHSFTPFNKDSLEEVTRKLSAIFLDHPEIFSSRVSLEGVQATVYFVNNEGTEMQFPFQLVSLTITAGSMTEDSDPMNKTLHYLVSKVDQLPDKTAIENDIRTLADNMMALRTAPRFDDEYFGPVLIAGEVAAETIEKFLFAGSDALISKRETLQSGAEQKVFYSENSNSLQAKVGKAILDKQLQIKSTPQLNTYEGIPLIGYSAIDAEGVVPAEELVLVEDGKLLTLLNGRTPSREVPHSNGHTRLHYSSEGLSKKVGPGVIQIEAREAIPYADLKQELMRQAREEGLDYAILIKALPIGGAQKPYNFYKVDLETGEETLTHAIKLSNLSFYSLKRSPRFSSEQLVHNTFISQNRSDKYGSGIPASFILPRAMLLKEIEISSVRKPLTSALPIIENPVGLNKAEQNPRTLEQLVP